jgi:hypothetical protein
MFVIKVKGKELYYNNRNSYGLHKDINQADVYNSEKGASIALRTFKKWWEWNKELNRDIHKWMNEVKDFDNDMEIREIREVEVKLK